MACWLNPDSIRSARRSTTPSKFLEFLDLDHQPEPDLPRVVQRFDERRHALAGEGRPEPRPGVEAVDLGQGQARDEARAVGGAVEEIVMHQHQLTVGGEHDVDLGRGAAGIAGRGQRGERVLRAPNRIAAVTADMDEAVLGGEQAEHGVYSLLYFMRSLRAGW